MGIIGGVALMLIVFACIAAPLLTPDDPNRVDLSEQFMPLARAHPSGTG